MIPEVYFDEAGNTGAALLDPIQPVFVLASVNFSLEECAELLALVETPQATEAKFTALRRSAAGRRKLLDFINSPLLSPSRAKTTVTHKRYMAVTKFIDIIEEPLAHANGIDMYERGGNIALANLHYYVTPQFCGAEQFDEFLASFIGMVRAQSQEAKDRFFAAARKLHDNCSLEEHKSSIAPYLFAEHFIDHILDEVTHLALDPAIPGFFQHCVAWGQELGGEFLPIHDASKPMAAERATFEAMMDRAIPPAVIGYDRRKFEFPLRASGLRFADSKDNPALQVADLLAGATAYFTSAIARGLEDTFAEEIHSAGIQELAIDALWPSPEVSPEELGTDEIGGVNAVDHITEALAGSRR